MFAYLLIFHSKNIERKYSLFEPPRVFKVFTWFYIIRGLLLLWGPNLTGEILFL